MNAEQFYDFCKSKNACEEVLKWITSKSLDEFWQTCERGDWMMWLIYNGKYDISNKTLRLLAVRFAREVQHLMTDQRSINALDVAERFANGEATEEELDAAWASAWATSAAAGAAAWATRAVANKIQANIIREFIPELPNQ